MKIKNYLAALAMVGGLTYGCSNNQNNEQIFSKTSIENVLQPPEKLTQKELWNYIPAMKKRPEIYDQLSYENKKTLDESMYKLASKGSIEGRIQRLERISENLKAVSQKRGVPYEVLAAVGSQESYLDKETLVRADDGGRGYFHMQSKTANEYGLETEINSKGYVDKEDGKKALELLSKNKGDWKKISSTDERFHILKNIDTAARILLVGKAKHGTWENAIRFYRSGNINSNDAQVYFNAVNKLKIELFDKTNIESAKDNFEDNNVCKFETFKKYQNIFHSENWGLEEYLESDLK